MEEAKMWLHKAIEECPYTREAYVEMALFYYQLEDFEKIEFYLDEAFKIQEKTASYINENFCWDSTIYDLYSIAKYYLGKKEEALIALEKAITLNPKEERLRNNLKFMKGEEK